MFLPTVFANENMTSTCEDFSKFSDEELFNFNLNFDNITFEKNTSN